MRTDIPRMRRPMRIRFTNRFKCLVCYLIVFPLPLLWQALVLRWIYPYKLAGTAPELMEAFRFLTPGDASVQILLAARESNWLMLVFLCAAAAWVLVLLLQLLWRFSRCKSGGVRATQRGVHTYRLMMLLVWGVSLGCAALVWQFGVRLIAGRTLWDLIVYFVFYLILPLPAAIVSRLAAPSILSGRHAFFKRL